MATSKEALAIVVDAGPSMGEELLKKVLQIVSAILQRQIFSESKDELAIVVCGSNVTENRLARNGEYEHIFVPHYMELASWDMYESVQKIEMGTADGDFIDALVVAMDILHGGARGKRFAGQRVVLLSNFAGEFSSDQVDAIIKGMKHSNINLNVIAPNLQDDDADHMGGVQNGNCGKAETKTQTRGIKVIKKILSATEGLTFSIGEADVALSFFKTRIVRPFPWKVHLQISNSLEIPVYKYVMVRGYGYKPWEKAYARDKTVRLQRETAYFKQDATAIERNDTIEAYKYGSTLVPFTPEDKENMSYKSGGKCLTVIGFTKMEKIKRPHLLGDGTSVVRADKDNKFSVAALSALINAMYETNMAAVARYVYSERCSPSIVCLFPEIEANFESLVFAQLPYCEDLRHFTFAPLDKKSLNIPSEKQLDAIDKMIQAMDLSGLVKNEDSKSCDAFDPKMQPNPYAQRLFDCCLKRVTDPESPVTELTSEQISSSNPPEAVLEKCKDIIAQLKEAFVLEVVEQKKRDRTAAAIFDTSSEPASKTSRLDTSDVTGVLDEKPTEIGTKTPVEDFLAIIKDNEEEFEPAVKQLQQVITQLVMSSFGELYAKVNHEKALRCLQEYRDKSIKLHATKFNDFLTEFRDVLIAKGKSDFLEKMKEQSIGPITSAENKNSNVGVEEATNFFAKSPDKIEEDKPEDEDADDLLAMM